MNARIAGQQFHFGMDATGRDLPEAWRDLDRAVWRWVRAHGGDRDTAHAAAWASHADGQGHSALPLLPQEEGGLPPLSAEQREAIARSPLVLDVGAASTAEAVATPPHERPFVLDGDHFYLLRNHRAEAAVAEALRARRALAHEPACPLTDDELRTLFDGKWDQAAERQRAAVRQAVGRRLMVLTGGPGTGKTTTVLRMLLGLSREHHARTGQLPQLRVAAPTGKAAQRLGESLRLGAEGVLATSGDDWKEHLQAVLRSESGTVHRLLGSRGRHGGFAYHAGEPLPADIVVIDEASMLDLGLLRALLAALREDAVLVLVGDADQLTSVGTGSVMMDIVQALEADPRGDLVRLEHCFRADPALAQVNQAVREGDPAAFQKAWEHAAAQRTGNGRAAVASHEVADAAALRRRLAAWERDLRTVLEQGAITTPIQMEDTASIEARVALLKQQQLLCAQRERAFGAVQAGAWIAARLQRWDRLAEWAGQAWYPGRCVMVTRNDAAAQLFNGDVGICVLAQDGEDKPLLRVAFEVTPELAAAGQKTRLVDPVTLPPHEDAFALTIHKSQGSEYERVAVLLPPEPDSPLLVRQTLYTGLSRAKASVELWSTEAATGKALITVLRRHGRLAQRTVGSGGAGDSHG